MKDLIEKYNVAGPRYTSYPTVPHWDSSSHDEAAWKRSVVAGHKRSGGEVSVYIHLPFCESLCTYCGCTTRITKNHGVEEKYIEYLLKEWHLYLATFPTPPVIKEIHLGGGTPTFFSAANLDKLITGITRPATLAPGHEFGFEGHPNNTSEEHLRTLAALGFTRVSFGIQDFAPEVQQIINRRQSWEQVKKVVTLAQKHGFGSINFDLIYGLPKQTTATIRDTISKTISLSPTRIAFYGYAHVPWIKAAQRSFQQFLPDAETRARMYSIGKQLLVAHGYHDIGMDHFALPDDKLYRAFAAGTLHRNFMGYTTQECNLLLGLGMSSISDSWTAFSQNEKTLPKYYARLDRNEFPILRGHQLTEEDLIIRKHILDIMCRFGTTWSGDELAGTDYNMELLKDLAADGLIALDENRIRVTDAGKPFVRNVCMALDAHLWRSKTHQGFSQTV